MLGVPEADSALVPQTIDCLAALTVQAPTQLWEGAWVRGTVVGRRGEGEEGGSGYSFTA